MKISINKSFILSCFACAMMLLSTSCDSFLDRQEDEKQTFDKIWESRDEINKYWRNAMSFLPNDVDDWSQTPWLGASDEATVVFSGRSSNSLIYGSWNPSNIKKDDNNSNLDKSNYYYKGIRECNIFLQNIDRCSDPIASKEYLEQMKTQARFARAFYYFKMMSIYGPVFLLGDEILDFSATTEALYRPRNTWEQCVDYVVSEMTALINDPAIQSDYSLSDYGLATKGTCQAVIARLKLYSARDLFNGNKLYRNVKNPVTDKFPELSGADLFPQTYDANKWLEAANAAKVLIDNPLYKLYRAGDGKDPYANYYGITQEYWNSELIWSTGYKGRYHMGVHTVPTGLSGTAYGGIGPTQQQVDAYAMNNGRYPITGYQNKGLVPVIDKESGYNENELELSTWTYPAWTKFDAYQIKAPNMYKDREPRFYVNVFFGGSYWYHGTKNNKTLISFAKGGNGNKTHDNPKSGYLINRFYDHTQNSSDGQWGNIVFPTFRLAEMYLNFVEAVFECKKRGVTLPGGYEQKALEVWADLRDRSGLGPITEAYPGATAEELIELCRKERRVEFSFEGLRYFDTRTWMIAKQTDNGPMFGMNTMAPAVKDDVKATPEDFWQRTVFENRVFRDNHYLFPFHQDEIERNILLTQNYNW